MQETANPGGHGGPDFLRTWPWFTLPEVPQPYQSRPFIRTLTKCADWMRMNNGCPSVCGKKREEKHEKEQQLIFMVIEGWQQTGSYMDACLIAVSIDAHPAVGRRCWLEPGYWLVLGFVFFPEKQRKKQTEKETKPTSSRKGLKQNNKYHLFPLLLTGLVICFYCYMHRFSFMSCAKLLLHDYKCKQKYTFGSGRRWSRGIISQK